MGTFSHRAHWSIIADTMSKDEPPTGWVKVVQVFAAFMGAIGSVLGAQYLLLRSVTPEIARPDPYTGTEGAKQAANIEQLRQEIAHLKLRVAALPPRELEQAVFLLRNDLDRVEQEFERWVESHDQRYVPAAYLQDSINRLERRVEALEK